MQRSGSGLAMLGAVVALGGAALAAAGPSTAVRAIGAVVVAIGVTLLLVGRRGGAPRSVAEAMSSGAAGAFDTSHNDVATARSEMATITEQAARLARGEPLTARPDTDVLAALHQVEARVRTMVEARVHIVATERDLDQARRMYRQILPLQSTQQHGGLSLAGWCTPAAETGGDWWTYRKLSGERILLVIGDATGHGVHSAMIGCMAHGAVRALTQLGEDFLSPRRVLEAVHTAIKVPGVDHASMTLFAALVDGKSGQVQYFNHGHVFPLIGRRDHAGTIIEVTSITGDRELDDSVEDSIDMEVRSGTTKLPAGAVLICFTDGLIERSRGGRPFGSRRLQQALLGAAVPSGVDGLSALRDRVLGKVNEYAEGEPLEDDITLVLCETKPS